MAIARVPDRLARDLHVRPSEATIRAWCCAHAAGQTLTPDYAAWVTASFSGVLCLDEVYEGRLALLVAVDPRAPDGDRLVGYHLVEGAVEQATIEAFAAQLAAAGIVPAQVITDGAACYPSALAKVWPRAAHPLCLFHETRTVLRDAIKVVDAVPTALPKPPRAPQRGGALRRQADPAGPSAADRDARLALVHRLRAEGRTIRAIVRQTGHSRNTIRSWLRGTVVPVAARDVAHVAASHLPRDGTAVVPPPTGWRDGDHVRQVRDAIRTRRYLVLARGARLTDDERAALAQVLDAPGTAPRRTAHAFVRAWYAIWHNEAGARRAPDEARVRYAAPRDEALARTVGPLARIQRRMSDARFAALSHFLRDPTWEATSNAAERYGRVFRHLQAPHFGTRTTATIAALLDTHARRGWRPTTTPRPAARPVGDVREHPVLTRMSPAPRSSAVQRRLRTLGQGGSVSGGH